MRESHMKTLETIPAPDFATLPASQSRLGSFGLSFVLQAAILVAITKTTISFVAPVFYPIDTHDNVHLVAPQLKPPPPVPQQVAKRELPKVAIAPKVELPTPKEVPPPIEVPKQKTEVAKVTPPPLPVVKTDTFHNPALAPGPKVPRPVVSTNFGGSSAPVTENRPARQVQTGGFGDPNGVPVNPNSTGKGPTIAKVGSFDLPEGGGSGNGTGGSRGVRGTVASAGFGNSIAVQGEGGSGGQRKVGSTNFDLVKPAASDPPKRQAASAVPKETPVALLSKPTPNYTSEARQRKIEGDVELDVEFSATGQVHVLRVLQGLGYGLDEAAVKAAENIRFAPARRDGQAVDSHGRLRIVFRLS
jgi:TonB family protein